MSETWLNKQYSETLEGRIREGWGCLLASCGGGTLFYQTPSYFDHLASCEAGGELFLAVAAEGDGRLSGIVPLRKKTATLDFQAKDQRFLRVPFSGLQILGGNLLTPPMPAVFDTLFGHLAASFKDCDALELRGLQTDSALWSHLNKSRRLRRRFIVYAPDGPRWCHTISVPESYEAYMAQFKKKKRYNLTRQIRCLDEWCHGGLTLSRVRTVDELPLLLEAFQALDMSGMRADDDLGDAVLLDLARRGLLLSYILHAGDQPCALAFGTVANGTFLIHRIKHDSHLDHLSPGAVMHVLIMKDLIGRQFVKRIDYGFGEPKNRLSTGQEQRISVFLIRKTLRNRLIVSAHSVFQGLLKVMKHAVQLRRGAVPAQAD